MAEKAKIFYFSVFILAVFAFVFHITAMGHHHWKKADYRNEAVAQSKIHITIGLFTNCTTNSDTRGETCYPNLFPRDSDCNINQCRQNRNCSCDYLPSTKGIAACTIIASIFLGLAIIILFIHSINTSETRTVGLCLGLLPLILLLLTCIFILIALILIGSYLSRDIMEMVNELYHCKLNFKKKLRKLRYLFFSKR